MFAAMLRIVNNISGCKQTVKDIEKLSNWVVLVLFSATAVLRNCVYAV